MNRPQTRETLANEIWRACDILRRDNNCGGIMEYIEHLSWLLFLRFLDAQEEEWETQAKLAGKPYRPIIEPPYRWRDWATKDWPADDLLAFVHGQLIPYLQNLGGDPLRDTIRSVFADRNVIVCASGYNLKDVIGIIHGIDFHSQDDIFTVSQVYEELLRRLGSENRLAGEFYTPRPVVRFIVELVDPKIGETVYDPACGTCGFLAQAYLHMRKHERTIEDHRTLQERTFYGQEKKPLPALLGLMNMVLHGVTTPHIARKNTLEENIRQVTERYDVIMTNPPFGGKEGRHIQQNFPIKSQATELLFLQHIMKKLKPRDGARCGMVVPEGTLFRGGAFAAVKRDLLEEFNLHTIVSLPPGTFAPYSDVKTALIFFERPGPTKEIWYYELPLPEGLKKFSKGSPIQDEHFAEARKLWRAWDAYRKGKGPREACLSEHSWIVSAEEIKQRATTSPPATPIVLRVKSSHPRPRSWPGSWRRSGRSSASWRSSMSYWRIEEETLMPKALDKQAVLYWLSGQRAAAERIETERAAFLAFLSPERSLQIYLELWSLCGGKCSETPSPLLLAMRRALSHMEGGKK